MVGPPIGGGAGVSPWLQVPSPPALGEKLVQANFTGTYAAGSDWLESQDQGRWFIKASTATNVAVSGGHLVINGDNAADYTDPYVMVPGTDIEFIISSEAYGEIRIEWFMQPDDVNKDLIIGLHRTTDVTAATDWEPAASDWVVAMHYNDSGKIACYANDSDGAVAVNDDVVAYTSDDRLGIIKIMSTEINFYYNDTGSTPITGTARTGVLDPQPWRFVIAAKSGGWNFEYVQIWGRASTW